MPRDRRRVRRGSVAEALEDATGRTSRTIALALALAAGASAAPGRALERETRTGAVSGVPLAVAPAPRAQLFGEASAAFDAAPLRLTLSDGGTWRREPWPPRWEVSAGVALRPLAAALTVGVGLVGLALQADVVHTPEHRLGVTAAARAVYGGGWDLSLVPAYGARVLEGRWGALVPFGAARVRWGRTLYAVQGWDRDRATPYARAETLDVAVAPMAGLAAVWRLAEVRLTAGWEAFLVDRVTTQERTTALSRAGGPFAILALRGQLGGTPR